MNLGKIIREGYEILKGNVILIVPPVVVSVIMTFLMLAILGGAMMKAGRMEMPSVGGGFFIYTFLVAVLSFVLHSFSQGMTIAMIDDILRKGECSLKTGFDRALSRISSLIGGGLIMGVLVALGMAVFFIPGLVVAFFLMFTFVSIVMDEEGAIGGLKASFMTVKNNLGSALSIFIVVIGIGLLVGIINAVFGMIPFLGHLVSLVIMGGFFSFVAAVLVLTYRELNPTETVE
jgi:hypothetical protein